MYYQSKDGLKLFADDRGDAVSKLTPVLCIPGLTRNSKDFEPVFELLCPSRHVIAVDLRGRGRSQYANDPKSYTPLQELDDVVTLLDVLGLKRVAVIGTSRGGIVGQLMAALHPRLLAGLLLNDIGPEINPEGYKHILGYLGKPRIFETWEDAADNLDATSKGFANVSQTQWIAVAKRVYAFRDQHPCTDYDMRLGLFGPTIEDVNQNKLATLWHILPALLNIPVTVLRGTGSNILDLHTVARMQRELPHLISHDVANRGHVPFLDEPESIHAITQWLAKIDAAVDPEREP